MALTAPVLFLLLLGIIEMGRLLWTQNALNYSVAEAARCAVVDTTQCASSSQIANFAAGRSGLPFAASIFTVTTASCGSQVSATYPIPLYIPFMSLAITLTAQSCYPR